MSFNTGGEQNCITNSLSNNSLPVISTADDRNEGTPLKMEVDISDPKLTSVDNEQTSNRINFSKNDSHLDNYSKVKECALIKLEVEESFNQESSQEIINDDNFEVECSLRINSYSSVQQAGSSKNHEEEDFVVIKNPDYEPCLSAVSCDIDPPVISNGVDKEFLPPPRTLDDPPIRRRKSKNKPNKNKSKSGKRRSKQPKENSPTKNKQNDVFHYNNSSWSNQIQDISADIVQSDLILPSMSSSASDVEKQINLLVEGINDNTVPHPTSYRFRKKSLRINYKDMVENDDEFNTYEKKFSCSQCELSFSKKRELIDHQLTDHENKQYPCDQCEKVFTSHLGVRRHTIIMHSQTKCRNCNKRFKIGRTLLNHMKVCGMEDNDQSNPKSNYYPCKECGRCFTERGNLHRHILLHRGILRFTCEHCGKKCSEKQALASHIRHIHSGERPYTCDQCPKAFTTKSDLNRHTKTVHSNVRQFMCSNCGKRFKTREALKAHVKIEQGELLWECGECGKRFISKGSLKVHMVVHSDIKLFECETCQRQFSHKGSLDAHMKSHTGLMPYDCSICGKKFAHIANRNRHQKNIHKL